MVGHKRDFRLIKDLLFAKVGEHPNGDRRCNVVAQNEIELRHNELARVDLISPGMCREDLLCHCHCHMLPLLNYLSV